jgi:transposase-like protein
LVRNGHAANGKQMYKCRSCGRNSRESPQHEKYTHEQKETILRAYQERPSMRGIERIFGLSRATLSEWLKKRPGITSAKESSKGASRNPAGS